MLLQIYAQADSLIPKNDLLHEYKERRIFPFTWKETNTD